MKAAPIVLDMAAIYQGLIITLASALVVYFARQISKTVKEKLEKDRREDEELRDTVMALKNAMCVDLVDKFERFSSFYLETGEITNEELDRLQDILTVGEPLGMNHNSRQRLKDCQNLKRVKVRTKRNPYYDYSSIKASE